MLLPNGLIILLPVLTLVVLFTLYVLVEQRLALKHRCRQRIDLLRPAMPKAHTAIGHEAFASPIMLKKAGQILVKILTFSNAGRFCLSLVAALIFAGMTSDLLYRLTAIFASVVFLGVWYFPAALKNFTASRRRRKIEAGLSDAIDLITICLEVGLGIDQSFQRVAARLDNLHPEFCAELRLILAQIGMGIDRRKAMRDWAARYSSDMLHRFAAMLVQSLTFGSPLAETLRQFATEERQRRLFLLEERVAKLPAYLTLPLVLFLLPSLLLVLAGPAILSLQPMLSRLGGGP